MRALKIAFLLAIGVILGGCASGVSRKIETTTAPQFNTPIKVISVTAALSDAAKQKATDNYLFNLEALKVKINSELEKKSLTIGDASAKALTVNVLIKDIRVRGEFAAVMFGFMAGSDVLIGEITLKDKDGITVDTFDVSASYAFGGLAGGNNETRLNWLYGKFGEEAAIEIIKKTGMKEK
jgi:hypothetical protein